MRTLSIVIPCYNERATISTLLGRVLAVHIPGFQKQIIVVDDGSTDGTCDILSGFQDRVTVLLEDKNRGKGAAVTSGLALVTGDFVLIQDADLEYAPEEIPALVAAIHTENSVVYGSRNLIKKSRKGFIIPRLGVWCITFLINMLYGSHLTDVWTCYKLFPAKLKHVFMAGRFESEIVFTTALLSQGFHIDEVPISHTPRDSAHGKKIRYRDGFLALWIVISYRFGRVLRFLVAGGTGVLVNLGVLYVLKDVFGMWYLFAAVVAFAVSALVSFILQKTWTFANKQDHKLSGMAVKYILVLVANLGINTLILSVLVELAHIHYLLGQIITSAVIAIESYFIYKRIFHEKK